ncbi:Glycerophosphocholine phosphodiesterase [Cladophialophora chaetospira]|uniref:Glycerophosphocholine phosphodiesterase n=1 Tax=Cladophialophora chaetospira TaxID=386627 RepID=A0AA38XH86_9EURO|nr:Glycerophosphocholine phosphodiesterase [Cladophialophora chaetospira]
MKFGRNLPRNQVPEWATSYIDYKGLKKLIKAAAHGGQEKQDGESPDLAGFLYTLDRNLEDVDQFYNKKLQDFSRRLKLLEDRYGLSPQAVAQLDADDREDLLAALLELRGQLRKLQWYGEVNRRGFIKITKKLDKRIPQAHTQRKYLELKVDPSPFATNAQLFASLNKINDWISVLGDVASIPTNDDVASISSGSLNRTTSRPSLNISAELLARIEVKIRHDDADSLGEWIESFLKQGSENSEAAVQLLLNTLLQRAISCRSRACTARLLQEIVFLDAQDDINRRNCIHRLVISISRKQTNVDQDPSAEPLPDAEVELYNFITPAAHPSAALGRSILQEDQRVQLTTRDNEGIAFLQFLLDSLRSSQRSSLLARDSAGKTPLHFAAEYGIKVMCEVIIEHLRAWKLFDVSGGLDGSRWQDEEGLGPLHLSAVGGHPLTTQALLDAEKAMGAQIKQRSLISSAVLALATKANYLEIVRLLVGAGVDINHQDEQGDTALHVAARFGHFECAKLLLEGTEKQKADIELVEKTYGWTPLFIACVDGHLPIVELLIEHGADLERLDSSGWNAKEHAALRGHVDIARKLDSLMPEQEPDSDIPGTGTSPPLSSSLSTALTERSSNGAGTNGQTVKTTEPVKTFGHRYLTDKSMVLVSLGTMDTRKNLKAVNLDKIPLSSAHSTQLDTALSVVVSAKSAEGEAEIIDLPVQDNISTEPIVFHTMDPSKVKIYFDLIPTYAGTQDRVVGRGVALLSSVKSDFGRKRMSLQGDVTVPIVAASDLEVIGSVTFNFLVITPFKHPNMSITENQTYWKSMASTMLIGHRGLGKNFAAGRRSLQLGENTIQSFIAAANLGASYVEFDVQLTKDHVPVIYHDFLVSETGIDAPVHTLTLEQFLHVNDVRTPRPSRPASPVPFEHPTTSNLRNGNRDPRAARLRSMSMGGADSNESLEMDERMKHTRDFKKKGFKGNSRGNHIQAPFATLEEMFKKIPQEVGFNIEMKYPMLFESEDEEMDTYAVELNSFVDTVLSKVYELGKGRNIIFSSFNPDICLLLSFKQPSIPVLFLTDAGTQPAGDIRATSLQEAIRFASRWNLLGIVSAAEPLVAAPRLVRVVKDSGLVCVSYGTLNNDNKMVRRQARQGIDAVIVDNVLAIRRGLTEDAAKAIGISPAGANAGLQVAKVNGDADGALEKKLLSGMDTLKIPEAVHPTKKVEVKEEERVLVNGSTQ